MKKAINNNNDHNAAGHTARIGKREAGYKNFN